MVSGRSSVVELSGLSRLDRRAVKVRQIWMLDMNWGCRRRCTQNYPSNEDQGPMVLFSSLGTSSEVCRHLGSGRK